MIYHIYWGTSGNSGLYLDEIYETLQESGHQQRAFVNYYFPFEYGDKVFLKYGDVSNSRFKGITRKIIQLLEILWGYTIILCCAIRQKPQLINYSHVGQSYVFIYWFLKLLKKVSGAKLIITCHDVCPHGLISGELKNREKIFKTGDYLLVHNDNSIKELNELFGVDKSKIVKHLFPIMDLSKLTKDGTPTVKDTDFLFIGHLRKDKGVEFLLEAWKDFHAINKDATLKVCGRKLPDSVFNEEELAKYNIEFHLRFIDDDEYYRYVKSARYVVLPYLQGTNSGIISTVLSLGTSVVTSDIPMFRENPLVPENNMFASENKESLIAKLQELWQKQESFESAELNIYKADFAKEVNEVYSKLLN